jgi:hypothetical protein
METFGLLTPAKLLLAGWLEGTYLLISHLRFQHLALGVHQLQVIKGRVCEKVASQNQQL